MAHTNTTQTQSFYIWVTQIGEVISFMCRCDSVLKNIVESNCVVKEQCQVTQSIWLIPVKVVVIPACEIKSSKSNFESVSCLYFEYMDFFQEPYLLPRFSGKNVCVVDNSQLLPHHI